MLYMFIHYRKYFIVVLIKRNRFTSPIYQIKEPINYLHLITGGLSGLTLIQVKDNLITPELCNNISKTVKNLTSCLSLTHLGQFIKSKKEHFCLILNVLL